ncbi:MAG: cytochrome bc complex cytochrome b subunit [Halodesulfurarchaeum sp.]
MGAIAWLAERLDLQQDRGLFGKAFPAEDSFLLGEIALFCFGLLATTGIYLGAFYEPSTTDVVYHGSVAMYQGEKMPAAYVSVLHITYDIPYGMFLRRMHHWAAHLFIAALGLHMLRVFFTGAYRNPREPNWVVGVLLALLAMFASYTGYSLPFDEFATTATGIGYNVARSVPIVGDFVAKLVFAGEFPTSGTIPRLYFIHVMLLPAAIAGLLAVHMFILIRQKHTEAPRDKTEAEVAGVDRDDDSVVIGLPAFPNQAAVSAVVFFLTAATLSLLAGLLPAHNVAEYGPSNPASTPALVMPDWFLMWLYGFLKIIPSGLGFTLAGIHVSTEFIGGVLLPGLVFTGIIVWPFVDRYEEPGHFTIHPLERPKQTAVGVGAVVLVMAASIAGMNNLLAGVLGTTTGVVTPALAVLVVAGPVVAAAITYLLASGYTGGEEDA